MSNSKSSRAGEMPAFPSASHNGMTLRDYFAAKALQGILSDAEVTRVMATGTRGSTQELCSAAYDIADAMLNARQS